MVLFNSFLQASQPFPIRVANLQVGPGIASDMQMTKISPFEGKDNFRGWILQHHILIELLPFSKCHHSKALPPNLQEFHMWGKIPGEKLKSELKFCIHTGSSDHRVLRVSTPQKRKDNSRTHQKLYGQNFLFEAYPQDDLAPISAYQTAKQQPPKRPLGISWQIGTLSMTNK